MTHYYHSIDITEKNQSFELKRFHYYRSVNWLQNITKCYEVTIVSLQDNFLEIGFTNEPIERNFCSYYGNNGTYYFLEREKNKTDHYQAISESPEVGGELMVCIDSVALNFSIIIDNIRQDFEITNLGNSTFWAVYLDSYGFNPDTILLNLGHTPFTNAMPDGFSPWVIPSIQISCNTIKQRSMIYVSLFLACIQKH